VQRGFLATLFAVRSSHQRGGSRMRRRDFIAGLGSAAAWPGARAQQRTMPVIGFLHPGSLEEWRPYVAAFHRGLAETGYVEGRNVVVEYRWGGDSTDSLPALAQELVRRRVAVIAAGTTPATLAAKAATATIPIVFATGGDPVAMGLVASLDRPGANLTGISTLVSDVAQKRLQLLRELIPNSSLFGVLADPVFPVTQSTNADLQAAARTLGLQLAFVNAGSDSDLETAFAAFSQQHVGAVLVGDGTFYARRTEQLAALAARHALPAIFPYREYSLAGGLVSYGASFGYTGHQVGAYTGRILNGANPADLPVEQATRIELIVNLKTAKALGIDMPTAILVRADEVIE
jgi:putative ABC transport system substrate-binding protein